MGRGLWCTARMVVAAEAGVVVAFVRGEDAGPSCRLGHYLSEAAARRAVDGVATTPVDDGGEGTSTGHPRRSEGVAWACVRTFNWQWQRWGPFDTSWRQGCGEYGLGWRVPCSAVACVLRVGRFRNECRNSDLGLVYLLKHEFAHNCRVS